MRADTEFSKVHDLVGQMGLHTVCSSAKCPNIHECWGRGTATLMILGNLCTRACRFCAIPAGRPQGLDSDEPRRVAEACRGMNLTYVVLTSVARDDLPDGGSGIFAETIRELRRVIPGVAVEVLTPDFQGDEQDVNKVLDASPDVFNHNLETVRSLQSAIRPQASYGRSLAVLAQAAAHPNKPAVKSGIMLGLGETDEELLHFDLSPGKWNRMFLPQTKGTELSGATTDDDHLPVKISIPIQHSTALRARSSPAAAR